MQTILLILVVVLCTILQTVSNSVPELHLYEKLEDFIQDTSSFFSHHVQFAKNLSDIQEIFDVEKTQIT